MSLSWKYHPELETRISQLVAANPRITAEQVTSVLNDEFEAALGEPLTVNQVQKRVQLAKRANGAARNVVELAERVERGVSQVGTGEMVPVSVTITETEADEGGSRRVSTAFRRRPTVERVEPQAVVYWGPSDLLVGRGPRVAERIVLVGDFQFPYDDPTSFRLFLAFLSAYRPDRVILTGDVIDFAKASRFASDPRIMDTQGELRYTHARLVEMVAAAGPQCRWQWAVGNHEVRFQRWLWANCPELVGLTVAGSDTQVLTVPHLLGLDALGVEWVGAAESDLGDDYANSHIIVAPDGPDPLMVAHGWVARKGAGVSALQTSEQVDCSVAVGHVHRQAITHRTKQGVLGRPRVLTAIETGTMSRLSLGYSAHKGVEDWQAGFATVEVLDDGSWTPDLARISPHARTLTWRSERLVALEPQAQAA